MNIKLKEYKNPERIFLEYNKDGSKFQEAFIKFAPALEADIKSSALNIDCSCTNKIIEYVLRDKENSINFLLALLEDGTIQDIDYDLLDSKYYRPHIGGKVAVTSMKEWGDFVKNLYDSHSLYSSMHLVKEGETVYVFFT